MSRELKEILVSDMFRQCTYTDSGLIRAMSDCCRQHATTVVEVSDNNFTYRCPEHRGRINATETGKVRETALTRDDVDPRLVLSWPERQG